jgi:sulfonate transport system substrate-binding protein
VSAVYASHVYRNLVCPMYRPSNLFSAASPTGTDLPQQSPLRPFLLTSLPKLLSTLSLTLLLALLLTMRSVYANAEGALPEKVTIGVIAYFESGKPVFNGTAAVIAEQGWLESELKKRGVALQWFPVPAANVGAALNEGFANRSIDFAGYGDLPSILLNAGGVETRIIVPSGRGHDTYLVVPKNSTAQSIEDLKGKRIAVHRGRPWEVPFIRLLDSKGLAYRDFRILNINPGAGAAAIASNSVDAMYTLSDAFLLEDKQVGKIIWSTRSAPADWKMRAELWGSKRFVDSYPELTQLVATAHIKAAYWSALEQNRDAVIRIAARSGTPESVVRRDYDQDPTPWRERWAPLFDQPVYEHYRHCAAYALDKKLIRKPVDADKLIDTRFVAPALQQLELQTFWSPSPGNADLAAALSTDGNAIKHGAVQ